VVLSSATLLKGYKESKIVEALDHRVASMEDSARGKDARQLRGGSMRPVPATRYESATTGRRVGARFAQKWRAFAVALTAIAATLTAVPVADEAHAATIDTAAHYVLVSRHSGKAIDVNGGSTSDGASIIQRTRADSSNQQWQFVDSGGGYYQLRARHSGKVIDVSRGSRANGADVVQASGTGATSQQFRVVDTDNGYVKLVNRNSGKALDLWGWSTADGARISQYTDTGGANQQWQLVKVGVGAGPSNAMDVVAAMEPGWNLGNSLDAVGSDETAWGNPRITQSLLNTIKAQGYNSVRIPVTWSAHQGGGPSYTIDPAYLSRVKEVVDMALAADLYVLINVHHDSWQWVAAMPTDHDNVLNRFNAAWTQIADTFRDSSTKLLYESINEPTFDNSSGDAQNAQLLDELNTSFHQIVRSSGGNNASRVLVLPTLHTSSDQARIDELLATFDALDDPNLAATMHFYGFWPFSVNIAGYTRYDAETQNDLTASFDRMANNFVARGIPVVLGEYGLLGFDKHTGTVEQGEKLKFFEYLGYYARTKGLTTMLWDNGQHLDRTTFQWKDPELFRQIQSSWTTRSGTASEDFVYNVRSSPITAKTITINRNGTSFEGVRQGSTWLTQGSDYTLDGDRLTFTESALTRLSGSRAYGVNAQVHLEFSQGEPWRVDIRTYDPPTLQNASGTTTSFAIPTTFRGDQLATMEAKYADGSNAGPASWTSYKEFTRAFEPNYGGSSVVLAFRQDDGHMPTDFFSEVNDGARVTLTFHFWSGTRVTYHVTKNGTTVTGSTS
jgi:aryl-phospho-beta-D-glucosidase BglC (GH1 family)